MLSEVLLVFVLGALFGQLLRRAGSKPRLWAPSTVAAAALLFVMGLSIGLARGTLLGILPEVAVTSLLLGAFSAVAGAVFAYLLRGRKKD